jgi:hypothetical protein
MKLYIADSATLTLAGELRNAADVQGEFELNRPGRMTLSMPLKDPLMSAVEPIKHCIVMALDGVIKWSGPIWTLTEDMPGDRLNIVAPGWLMLLHKRVMRTKVVYNSSGRGTIIHSLLGVANTQQATWIVPGSNGDTSAAITKTAEKDSNIGQLIEELTSLEASPDIDIHPTTRNLNIRNWNAYADETDVVLGYNWGPNNVQQFQRTIDADQLCNRIKVYGKEDAVTPALVEDVPSQSNFRLFEETVTLSDVYDSDILLAYGGVEIVYRKTPRITYQITPNEKAPILFKDFTMGDQIYFKATGGRSLIDHPVRVFQCSMQRNEAGNAVMTSFQTVAG